RKGRGEKDRGRAAQTIAVASVIRRRGADFLTPALGGPTVRFAIPTTLFALSALATTSQAIQPQAPACPGSVTDSVPSSESWTLTVVEEEGRVQLQVESGGLRMQCPTLTFRVAGVEQVEPFAVRPEGKQLWISRPHPDNAREGFQAQADSATRGADG